MWGSGKTAKLSKAIERMDDNMLVTASTGLKLLINYVSTKYDVMMVGHALSVCHSKTVGSNMCILHYIA